MKKASDLGIPVGWAEEGLARNWFVLGAQNTTFDMDLGTDASGFPRWFDVPVIRLVGSDTVGPVMHELVHDYIDRHLSEPDVHHLMAGAIGLYKGTKWDDGSVVTEKDAPRAATEAFASFVAGQIEARSLVTQEVSAIMGEFTAGNLNQAQALAFLDKVRAQVNWLLDAKGHTDEHGALTTSLSSGLKQEAADTFLGGTFYDRFEDIPGVSPALEALRQAPPTNVPGKP